jgi:putative OPT family oligopeptide transporter
MDVASSPRELTARVIVIGLVLSVVMAAANVYLGLKAGMTVSASIPAAVIGMLILRSLFRDGTVLEANQIQTAASAGESLAAGIIFTMPALVLIQVWERFDLVMTALIAFSGGLLGILFMIPMRKVFVVENRDLPYPEGLACAAVLQAVDEPPAIDAEHGATATDARESRANAGVSARSVVIGGIAGASFKFLVSYLGILKGSLEAAVATAGSRILFFGADISPALLGVGFIVRLNVSLLIFLGGAFGWLVCIPLLPEINALLGAISPSLANPLPTEGAAGDQAWSLWSQRVRYIGVGAMAVGGISSIARARHGLVRAISELRAHLGVGGAQARIEDPPDSDRDLSSRVIIGFLMSAIAIIAIVYANFTGSLTMTAIMTVTMVVLSFFFVAVSCYIVGLVGNSNNPVSGMTITAVLVTGGLLLICGYSGASGMVATLGVAAIVCCAACTAGDVCNDLKTGSLVGATPWRQQAMQIAGIAVAAVVMAPVLQLLHDAYTIGSRELAAPQASLFASLARGFFGDGELPWGMVLFGVAAGLATLAIDRGLERSGSEFRAHLMPVAVGIYLPLGLSVPILIGGLIAHFHGRGASGAEALQQRLARGVLFASGIIAGESLMGVVIALLVSAGFAGLALGAGLSGLVTLAAALGLLAFFYQQTRA